MKSPDFLCIGAQKSGTTWLHKNLLEHPNISFPHLKELHYYDEIEAGICTNLYCRIFNKHWKNEWWRHTLKYSMYEALKSKNVKKFIWLLNYFFSPRGKYWYMSLFPNDSNTISGELTPEYAALSPKLIKRIHNHFPEVKIILLLRNPIEREWSGIKMWHKRVRNVKSMDEVESEFLIAQAKQRNDLSEYCTTIENWTATFPRQQILIRFFDEIVDNPRDLLQDVYSFLGIEGNFQTGVEEVAANKGLSGKIPSEIKSILWSKYKQELLKLEPFFEDAPINYVRKWLDEEESI